MPPEDRRALLRANTAIGKAEDALIRARWALMDEVERLMKEGTTQSEIARVLGINRASLNIRVRKAGILFRAKPAPRGQRPARKQGKQAEARQARGRSKASKG